MRKLCPIIVVFALIGASGAHAQGRQMPAAPPVDYATFMQQDNQQRLRVFNRLTAEQQKELLLIHLSRWMAVNMSYLTQEQEQALIDFANVVDPPMFRLPGHTDTLAWRDDVVARVKRLFSPAEISQALTIYGDYIPAQWPSRTR